MKKKEKQKAELLLVVRFMMIARYPFCKKTVGEIFFPGKYADDYWGVNWLSHFPHIFKKLQWWEHRKINEMPEYIKFTKDYMDYSKGDVFKFEDWSGQFKAGFIPFRFQEGKYGLAAVPASFNQLQPATKEEYDNRRNK